MANSAKIIDCTSHFPLSLPGFVVVMIWQFTNIWNDFIFVVTIAQNQNQPMTVALNNIDGKTTVEWNVQMAAAFLIALPTLLVYIILGRYFLPVSWPVR